VTPFRVIAIVGLIIAGFRLFYILSNKERKENLRRFYKELWRGIVFAVVVYWLWLIFLRMQME
jgi:hypothetical protein